MTTRAETDSEIVPGWIRSDIEKRIHHGMLELPLLSTVAAEALELCMARDGDAEKMANILHRDQALAGNVVRVANSPMFGAAIEITSLKQAVGRIGLRMITDVVLSVATKATIFDIPCDWSSCVRELPRLSLVSGLYGRHVARACNDDEDRAFLSGFLHDMGWPVVMMLLQKLEKRHDQIIELPVVQAAGDRYHAAVGAELATSWGIADSVSDAIRHHEDWEMLDAAPAGAPVVSLADHLARVAMDGFPETAETALQHPALELLELDPGQLKELLGKGERVLHTADAII